MLLGVLCAILGYQTFWLGLCSTVLGVRSGDLPPGRFGRSLPGWLTIERGLAAGGSMFLAGLAVNSWLVWEWREASLGALDVPRTLREALWGMAGMSLGLQTIYGSCFLGVLTHWAPATEGPGDAQSACREYPPPMNRMGAEEGGGSFGEMSHDG